MSVPTPDEEALIETLEDVREAGQAHCRLCNEPVPVDGAASWGDVFDALADHGEARDDHEFDDIDGWRLTEADST